MKKILKFVLIVGGITAVAKLVSAKKAEWHGLSEAEAREKLATRLPDRIPEKKREAVADAVVSKMRDRGALREEEASATPSDNGSPTE